MFGDLGFGDVVASSLGAVWLLGAVYAAIGAFAGVLAAAGWLRARRGPA